MISWQISHLFLQANETSMLLANDKIGSVLAVIGVIFLAFIFLMVRQERRISKLEKEIK